MKRGTCLVTSCFIVLIACVVAGTASAAPINSTFSGTIDPLNNLVVGGGTGYDDGYFFPYPQPDGPIWWNQWFFNNEEIVGWKDIFYDITLTPSFGTILDPGFVSPTIEVALNWSNTGWLDPLAPPINGEQFDAEPFIERYTVFHDGFVVELNDENSYDVLPVTISNPLSDLGQPIPFLIEDYNPIWVSIDIRTTDPGGIYPIQEPTIGFSGTILHEHHPIPEPSLMLASLGLIGFLSCRRRRRA